MNNEHYDERASVIDHSEDSNPNILSEKMPENATNVDEIDSIIAQQMMKLSVEDREKVYSDVHGVKEGKKENEEMIQDGLDSMQREIEKLQHKEAYDMACTKDQKYVESRSFQLAFLRADSFDARKAAIRFVRHFQVKLDLFGEEKLVMDIVQDDLDRDTMGALYSGTGQILDTTDSAGRCIIAAVFGAPWTTRAYLQRAFYNTMMTIRDPYKQIHGYIIVVYSLAHSSQQGDASKHYTFSRISEGLPVRIEALHLCHDSPKGQVLLTVSKAALNPSIKIRTRTHYGKTICWQFLLLRAFFIQPEFARSRYKPADNVQPCRLWYRTWNHPGGTRLQNHKLGCIPTTLASNAFDRTAERTKEAKDPCTK